MTAKRTWERKRNQYAGHCKVCGIECPPGTGWLYSDTATSRGRSTKRSTGRWAKFVKCSRCHELNVAHRSQLPENQPPVIVRGKVTVADVRGGRFVATVERYMAYGGERSYPAVRLVLADGSSEVLAYPAPISWDSVPKRFDDVEDGENVFGGRDLTPAARAELNALTAYAVEMLDQVDPYRVDE